MSPNAAPPAPCRRLIATGLPTPTYKPSAQEQLQQNTQKSTNVSQTQAYLLNPHEDAPANPEIATLKGSKVYCIYML